ncbi:hypothetical protein RQM65_11170 [Pricia sp. S334]|uniref:Uncharacterized protein n=1 Tax=Pricia mediterranea TaxID=3076079 RepID=A0ABU3L789_9FLAO|nr:hypothetical protein [Pricia sp. S334]MDT7829228.1 hypothetical protein [Pricia sp. S334]
MKGDEEKFLELCGNGLTYFHEKLYVPLRATAASERTNWSGDALDHIYVILSLH